MGRPDDDEDAIPATRGEVRAALERGRAEGEAKGIRETKESEFRLALQAITAAIREEREACAKIADAHASGLDCEKVLRFALALVAKNIRARDGK